ncbi:flagellar hook-length control protein FliK [Duganella sp. FT92W]|uniref:Flagellar hook-length control protein FliK n=1 Tax=Pseudoduganella rivuli TaxID=2666085 RepID=A0A7X2IK44_9BURK|nr:flagellar hook-length control protein FliK [Pseudoduganella rivuli]MRV71449.1 flagellar hook-length control protein FliK [Pseudoduganella rivuli]
MLPPRLDAAGVKPAGAVTPPAAAIPVSDARQAMLARTLGSMVGQSMQGQVLSNYQDGSSLVRVAGASVRMMLPPGTQVGAELPMTLLSVTPRPTFQIGNNTAQTAVPLYSEAGLAQGDAGEAAQLPSQNTPMAAGRQPNTGAAGMPLPAAADAPAEAEAAAPHAPTAGQAANAGANPAAAGNATSAAANAAAMAANAQAQAAAGKAAQAAAQFTQAGQAGAQAAQPGNAAPAQQARPQSLGAMLLSKAPLTPSDQLPDLGRDTPAPSLSQGARSIASALANAYHTPDTPATIAGKTPLVQEGAPEPKQLAKSLQDALGASGLFYESHVAEWAEGKRPLADLQREPQMQRPETQSGRQSAETLARAAQMAPDLTAAQMINQQLHAHEQQRVQWNGEAWPGQPMQWDVQREERDARDARREQEERDASTVWRSGVRFSLPMLGKVAAAVTLVGDQVHIQLQAGSDGSADTMRAWAGELQRALDAAGSPLASLSIGTDHTITGASDGEAA